LIVVLGDVSGKGLRAAMVVSMAVGAVRAIAKEISEPAEILTRLNRELAGNLKSGFVTCLCARFDANGTVTVANAGHLPPWLNGKEFEMPGALQLGMLADQGYESQSFQMNDGERIMVMSDGVVEARNEKDGQLYGFARLATLLTANPSAQHVAEEALNFGQEDDISVLSVTRTTNLKAVPA
jgi:serine phosphatase RsbU (regulator of sigma subunit)